VQALAEDRYQPTATLVTGPKDEATCSPPAAKISASSIYRAGDEKHLDHVAVSLYLRGLAPGPGARIPLNRVPLC
jgi:hypothetical protein